MTVFLTPHLTNQTASQGIGTIKILRIKARTPLQSRSQPLPKKNNWSCWAFSIFPQNHRNIAVPAQAHPTMVNSERYRSTVQPRRGKYPAVKVQRGPELKEISEIKNW